jgi:cell division septum initiation protein DivIVA
MALSFSRPDPSSPSALASANFTQVRRGADPNEVRELLRMVAAEMARLQEREKFLERELRTAQRTTTAMPAAIDEEVVTKLLGEEAARVLAAAREASSQIRVRAEEGAARLLREATDEAQRMREEAGVEAARRRHDAAADAEAELQMAKQQGREMVNEARSYRERVLSELSRRREMARQQIEQLVHGRDRLLQAFERARLAAVDVMAELEPLGEPNEYVNLAPITGPVPVMVPAAMVDTDGTALLARPDVEHADADEPSQARLAARADADGAVAAKPVALYVGDDTDLDHATLDDLPHVGFEQADETPADETPVDEAPVDDEAGQRGADVDDLFARLRAARVDKVVATADDQPDGTDNQSRAESSDGPAASSASVASADGVDTDDAPPTTMLTIVGEELGVFDRTPQAPVDEIEVDDTPFARRDAVLTPLIVAAGKRMKRALADEQNEVLASLRRNDRVRTLDTMLPWAADHAERYTTAIETELMSAALAGSATVSAAAESRRRSDVKSAKALKPAQEAVMNNLVAPLRERLERAIADAADNDDLGTSVRAIYREWKTQRIDEHLDDIVRLAFGRGVLASLNPGQPVCWIVDPAGPPCPDAEDNALAGVVGAGDAFPTDHTFAPAHAGCRCMVVPSE